MKVESSKAPAFWAQFFLAGEAERGATFRLCFALIATSMLLSWVALVPGSLPNLIEPSRLPATAGILGTSILAAVLAVLLIRVLLRGSSLQRACSALILMLPVSYLAWIVAWSLMRQ